MGTCWLNQHYILHHITLLLIVSAVQRQERVKVSREIDGLEGETDVSVALSEGGKKRESRCKFPFSVLFSLSGRRRQGQAGLCEKLAN